MAAFEGSMKSQLQGVSQQIARERLDGQVSAQENMLSDVVTGLRRRPGAEFQHATATTGGTKDTIHGWSTDIGGRKVKLALNASAGILRVYDDDWTLLKQFSPLGYFQNSSRRMIQATTVGDRFIIANKSFKPAVNGIQGGWRPGRAAFFYIKVGAFEKDFTIIMNSSSGTYTWTYRTPAASVAGAADQSTPEYIASQLVSRALSSGWQAGAIGAYGFIYATGDADVGANLTTPLPSGYIVTSNNCYVPTQGDLPARLPAVADTFVCQVGSIRVPTYYKYSYAKSAWLECGAYGAAGALINMPWQLYYDGTDWQIEAGNSYEGCLAGDATSNPVPAFVSRGITGIGSFQGRLVILSGNRVNMSGSNNPKRFFRTTMEALLASDPIEVGSSANSSAAYEYAVPFQKDLLLFSEKYQALIPGSNQAVTPSNASVVITSTYEADMNASPLALGRTLVYPAPRSKDFYGMREMVPSQYTDSQYLSEDVTAHIPKYLAGRCRFAVSSSTSNIAVFASTTDYKTLIVHEYLWSGDDKVQQAWHRWTFPYDIADAFFAGSEINLMFMNGSQMLVATIDPRIGSLTAESERRPFLDLYMPATVAGRSVPVPAALATFDPTAYQSLRLADTDMELLGEEVGVKQRFSDHLVTVPSFEDGPVTIGLPYRSSFSPTTPMVKDSNGVVISSNKLGLLRYMVGTANSYEYEAIVRDVAVEADDDEQEMSTLYWGSAELDLGQARVNTESTAILPCRTNAATTTLVLFTEGLGEMNVISLEYVCRYNQKLRRR